MAEVDSIASNGPNGFQLVEAPLPPGPDILVDHLVRLLGVTLGASRQDFEAKGSFLSDAKLEETLQRCARFLNEPRVTLYAQKRSIETADANGVGDHVPQRYLFTLSSEPPGSAATVSTVAILRGSQPIDGAVSLSDQLRTINLTATHRPAQSQAPPNQSSPFEILHSIVHSVLAPYFDAATRSEDSTPFGRDRPESEQRIGIPGAKKKLAELELSLLQLQQNAEIPELSLPLHPIVISALSDAAERHAKPSLEFVPKNLLTDSTFLNSIQALVNGWIKSIQTVTKTTRDPSTGSATQEINFWLSMETALEDVETQLRSEGISLTMEILKNAKRYQATLSFSADTGLKETTELVQKYNQLMRDFPLDELLSAPSLDRAVESLDFIFAHMNKKLRVCPYPVKRALPLVEAISGDLDSKIHSLLNGRALMQMTYQDFEETISKTNAIWRVWDENIQEFTNVARDVLRRRNEKFIPIKIMSRHAETQERLKYISNFRTNHENLQNTIRNVLGPGTIPADPSNTLESGETATTAEFGDVDAVEEVSEAYSALRDVNVLDVSLEGTRAWERAEMLYNERTSRVENSIIARLRDRLATAKTANEMFRVFSKFNALFIRPKIRGAISEYQTQLIDNVKQDISALHERFKQQYGHSQAHAMAQLHDLPPVAGAIIWARQIERQLDAYMKKVEDVLGTQWDLHSEGQKLKNDSSNFRKKLDTRPVFDSWVHDVTKRNLSISGRLFGISKNRATGNVMELTVNFDAQVISLFKEVRNLLWLNYSVPHAIVNLSKAAKRVYPYAVSLMESVRTFIQTTQAVASMAEVAVLLSGYTLDAQRFVAKGIPLKWESFANVYDLQTRQATDLPGAEAQASGPREESLHAQFIRDFSSSVMTLQAKATTLASVNEIIQKAVAQLRICIYDSDVFQREIIKIQTAVDQLSLENYTNLPYWVSKTNESIESILLERLEQALMVWIATFENPTQTDRLRNDLLDETLANNQHDGNGPRFHTLVHEISMRNQIIYLEPPLDYARGSWLAQLHDWVGIVCKLRKIQASRYEINVQNETQSKSSTYFSALPRLCAPKLALAYECLESRLDEVNQYIDKWLQFQSLWDLQNEQVYQSLGEDLSLWLNLLQDIRKTRATFDTSETKRHFGNVTIDYEQAQMKVNAKYDLWQHEILNKFADRLGSRINVVFADFSQTRKDLENSSLEASSTAQAVAFITAVQSSKRKVQAWAPEVEIFRQGQTALSRHRYHFSTDWLFVERLDHEWTALNEILDRKSKLVLDQTDALRAKVAAEDNVLNQRIVEIFAQWKDERPISGSIPPKQAMDTLTMFAAKLNKLSGEHEMVTRAKEALELPSNPDSGLATLVEEVNDFQSVWSNLSTIWSGLDDLRETLWTSVQPRKLRQALENLLNMTKEMPSRMRQYEAFDYVQSAIRQLVKVNPILSDLRSEAIRERHWIRIFKALRPLERYSQLSMTLGQVWDLQLLPSEKVIRDIIAQAQGEMALEEYLRQVRDTWQNYTLDLVNYQNKCRLIRGWDDLFAKCSDNLNSLQAMRLSPYYKEFEDDASAWEERLNKVHVLFDVWIDVQRQWIYLEGVFTGNADIKHLLPTESARFQNINSEFYAVMKKVHKSPLVLEVLSISGVQKSLERLADLLGKIQKALGEYLERERMSFPRFYFVGDEDLLEIIGNSSDTARIAKHLGKMFAGISGLLLGDDAMIVGFHSKEAEEVYLKKEISLVKTPKINEWLTALEQSMQHTLAELLSEAVIAFEAVAQRQDVDSGTFQNYLTTFPAQIVILAAQVWWTNSTQSALQGGSRSLRDLHGFHVAFLHHLAGLVIGELEPLSRKKCESLITEFVYQRDAIEKLTNHNVDSPNHYLWMLQMRYIHNPEADVLERVQVKMANATINYGFEYLGVMDRLVRTPLTDRCFLTLTQALCQRLGGSPYGPAGTGKTETVKALGSQLGRFTLVFCCDDTFDFQAMGRIFLGICQVGAWGCFDEFNRLEERILSAVSQQVQNIQIGLRKSAIEGAVQIELVGRQLSVNTNTGIFITMNPGYAGRSNLPDNLKKLFRSVAMSKPDKELIAEVTLYSQGFNEAKGISRQIVPFFDACAARLSAQAHYDFGLRALKSVLISSGGLKRSHLMDIDQKQVENELVEPQIIIQSIRETVAPKLIEGDVKLMQEIEAEVFPGIDYVPANLSKLEQALRATANERKMVVTETWLTKALQLFKIQELHHGVMMVGNCGSGKSVIWNALLHALEQVEGIEGVHYIIDPKVMSKEALYGTLDNTTREWTDGLFTSILRKIIDNLRGESSKRHWIVFDGDVDPEWVENLNSVLDDNKLLTLPNGERLVLPANVRILFEVESLKHATLATVSRCGMVWFSHDIVTPGMIVDTYLGKLRTNPLEDFEEDSMSPAEISSKALEVQTRVANLFHNQISGGTFLEDALLQASQLHHIMEFTDIRALTTLFSMLNKTCRLVIEYDLQHPDFPLLPEQIESFISKKLILAMIWSFAGDCSLQERQYFGEKIGAMTTLELPEAGVDHSLLDFEVSLPNAVWSPWQAQVPTIELNTHSVTQTDVVIPTLDTVRHEDVLYTWLAEHRPLMLCGPPGSGKTMTLFSALRKLPNMEVVGLNFSSATTPDLLLKSFEQHCEYRKTLNGVILSPTQIGRWLVLFCDEINLPARDKYGTQRVIAFLRQMIEYNGFWRTSDKSWITLERIQFVGACNPPTDAGRVPLGLRFLRHAPLVMVDYPGEQSLLQIYGAFNNAVLKIIQPLRGHAEALTNAMVKLYSESQQRFTPKIQPHYVYSPRELTRWVRGLYEAIKPLDSLDLNGLVRIWAHEAMRLFQDRLIDEDERQWSLQAIHRIALEQFPTIDGERALGGPILFSNWLSKHYVPVNRDQLREYVQARLKTFCEEEVDVPLVLYDDALDHVLRIDRVFRQPQGHLILIGVSGSGKTTLSRFVAWMNGLNVFQIKIHGKYSAEDFDEDLRDILRRTGCKGEKMCFIMDESNVLDSAFLEKMNTLLANAEVPGLFEGDEYASLMTACKEGAQRQGLLLDSQDELYKWFTQQIVKNLHVVFTMNPPEDGLSSKAATSPALFNRCVLNWFGDWSDQTLFQVGLELTHSVDLDRGNYVAPDSIPIAYRDLNLPPSHREAVVNAMVYIHNSLHQVNRRLQKQQNKVTFLTPRHFLDFVAQYARLYGEKRDDLEEQQRHLNVGLDKLRDTVEKVRDLRRSLAGKKGQLEQKDIEANEKLQRMVSDQQEAEQRKATSLEIQAALDKQEKEVADRKDVVLKDLANAEPAVVEAQKSVSNIKRQHLTEVRSMTSPPAGVKLALESVCTLLGHKVENWKAIQAIVRRDDFIASIVNYDNEKQMTKAQRIKMRNEFLSLDEFTYERVNRASKACGPLVQWVHAQVSYSEILDRVGPLRDEVSQLEEQALQTKAEAQAIQNNIKELEESIATYKSEYAALISETQAIKAEMTRVQTKVDRSLHLLDSLASERKRWEEGSKTFQTQIDTIVGDVLAAAAFVTYGGLYDQQYRKTMMEDWLHHLSSSGISFKPHNPMIDYLSTADERLQWQSNSLPVDDLCTENAIILKRFNRYPLIIDPSGRIPDYLQKESTEQRLTVTSFLDSGFIKQVESALRFGNAILIQDAEYLDPVLNHVLNREYQKTGGRILIQLGKQEIDFSPSFRLYLLTRDPSASFAPDICSRTAFVNFTVTQSSLQTQSLNDVLKSERPDIDERRTNLIKMQSDFRIHLRRLEKSLLQALNESRGNILDDDAVIETLQTLKNEVAVVTAKVAETEGVMNEVESITQEYKVIAKSCSAIFAVLEQLRHINHFYQFSLQYFINIFQAVLQAARDSKLEGHHKSRVDAIVQSLFTFTFRRTSLTVLQKDRMTLAMLLAQASPYKMDKSLFDLLRDEDVAFNDISMKPQDRMNALSEVKKLTIFKDQLDSVSNSAWDDFLTQDAAENYVPSEILGASADVDAKLRSLTLMKLLRADRLVPASQSFILQVFGPHMFDDIGDLNELIDQVPAITPLALCCSPGFDASFRVDNLVEKRRVRCANIAMGSTEGIGSADKAIGEAAAVGSWVFIKNVHLALTWLQSLEKRLDSLKPHADFRIFLSMECNPKIPVNLLRSSRVLMCEQPAGIRANIKDSLIPVSQKATKAPVERTRLYLLLSILHGVIQERLRYAPTLGWNAFWEFNDADYECSSFVLDTWVDWAATGRANLSPSNIPWDMIRSLIVETYGGKIDNEQDFARLAKLVQNIFTPATFDEDYNILKAISMDGGSRQSDQSLHLPVETRWQNFLDWVNRLPEREPPSYLGLPANAEKLLMFEQGKEMVGHVGRIISILDESEQIMAEASESS